MKIKAPPQPAVAPIPRRDDALAGFRKDQRLLRRRGSAADILTGSDGAEPGPVGVKALLGM
ncbi:MAG: hypothetical protein ACK4IS_13310 [Erythrobacter sp.]